MCQQDALSDGTNNFQNNEPYLLKNSLIYMQCSFHIDNKNTAPNLRACFSYKSLHLVWKNPWRLKNFRFSISKMTGGREVQYGKRSLVDKVMPPSTKPANHHVSPAHCPTHSLC